MFSSSGALCILCAVINTANGAQLPACVNGRLTIKETLSSSDILCYLIDTTTEVSWSLILPDNSPSVLGLCSANGSCEESRRGEFDLNRSGLNSTLTIAQSQYRKIGSFRISCTANRDPVAATCDINIVYPPDVTCVVSFISDSWTFNLSCDVTKTYSSRDTYWCTAYSGTTQNSQPNMISSQTYITTAHNQAPYRQGTCSFSVDNLGGVTSIPSNSQLYFKVDIYPGPTSVTSVVNATSIVRPDSPTIICPALVEENSPFTCTCTTSTIGHPAGRLRWSGPAFVSVTGNYGDSSLATPSLSLTRQDHNITRLTCEVMWAEGTYRQYYTTNVGYKTENLRLIINSVVQSNVTVDENESVNLTCQADARPVATVVLEKEGVLLAGSQSPLAYMVGRVRCEDTGRYSCFAYNIYGQSNNVTQLLFVRCSPRGPASLEAVNVREVPTSRHFIVTAFPLPTEVAFSYIGAVNSSHVSDVNPCYIGLNGSCVPGTSLPYQARCTVTVDKVMSREAAGLYRLTVRNSQGETTVTLAVVYDEADKFSTTESTNSAAVVLGVLLAVVVTANAAALLWMWRHHWYLPCTDSQRRSTDVSKDERLSIMPQVNYVVDASETSLSSDQTAESCAKPANMTNIYSQLEASDIGQKSTYSQLSQGAAEDRLCAIGPIYSNT